MNAPRTGPLLVTGGRGFVGAAVVRHWIAQGFQVHVLGPANDIPLPAGATETVGSIEDADLLHEVMARTQPMAVAHFAAFSAGPIGLSRSGEVDPQRMMAVNVLGFRNVLEACVQAHIPRVIWTSSTVVLGRADSLDRRLDETAPRRPIVNYGLSKVLAEEVADYFRLRHGLQTVALRIPLMLGPGLWYDGAAAAVRRLVEQALTGQTPTCHLPASAFDAMHVDDMGPLVQTLLRNRVTPAPLYHVAGFTTTYREIVQTLKRLVPGFDAQVIEEDAPIVYPLISQALLERDTGWRPGHNLFSTLQSMLDEQRRTPR